MRLSSVEQLSHRGSASVDVEDLLELDDHSDSSVLHSLQERFEKKRIYTNLGSSLLAVNPHERYPIYDEAVIKQYTAHTNNTNAHVFGIARSALDAIRAGSKQENIVFTGESGSGKSWQAQHAARFLAATAPGNTGRVTVQHIEALHTVFTAFGCAKTSKNDSATRLGHTTEILFKNGGVEGLCVRASLPMETLRVVRQRMGEGNMNVFYEVVAGLSADAKAEYGIKDGQKFFFLNQGRVSENVMEDRARYAKLRHSLELLGLTEEQRDTVDKVVLTILHLGNIYFRTRKSTNPAHNDEVDIGNLGELKWASHLMQVDMHRWQQCFISKMTKSDDGFKASPYNVGQALDARDSLAQLLFSELVDWILLRVSQFFRLPDADASIAIVDHYGFERYNNNSLEQLSINTANEKMHALFARKTFHEERAAYSAENVQCEYEMPSLDNERTIDLLTRRPYGLLPLLDDECKFPKASDESYLQHANLNHLDKSVYGKARNKERAEFSVRHFAGHTWYSVHDFVASNRRVVSAHIIRTLAESANQNVSSMFRALLNKDADHVVYGGATLIQAVNALVEKLADGSCRFVRCIRANNERVSGKFDLPTVSRQLKSYALVDSLQFRAAGYPIRIPFAKFVTRYRCLLPADISCCQNQKEIMHDILEGQGLKFADCYKIGTSHVFLRDRLSLKLERMREEVTRSAALIVQKTLRGHAQRQKYLRKRRAALTIQSGVRGWKARKECAGRKEEQLRRLGVETKRSRRLNAYHNITQQHCEEAEAYCPAVTPVQHLDVSREAAQSLEKPLAALNTRTVHHYLTIPPRMLTPLVQPMRIEDYAEEYFKGHLLEMRREPIITPFLAKDNDLDYRASIELFKLVLRYLNDTELSAEKREALGRYIIQQGVSNPAQRDELYVQLCNQTYKNTNKANAARAWFLLQMASHSFPPTLTLLPMLCDYFGRQPAAVADSLKEGLLRRIKTADPQASRLYAPSRLEQAALAAHQSPVVEVHCADEDAHPVEAHHWATLEEIAARVLRHRGIADTDGWSVVVESVKGDILPGRCFAPAGCHFLHDVLCEIESRPDTRSAFFNYPPDKAPAQAAVPAVPTTDPPKEKKIKQAPVEKRRDQRAQEQSMDREKEKKRAPSMPLPTIPTPTPGQFRETYKSLNDSDADYCYTLPVKKNSTDSFKHLPEVRADTLSRLESRRGEGEGTMRREGVDKPYDFIEEPPIYQSRVVPSTSSAPRYDDYAQPAYYSTAANPAPHATVQYVQFVPMMMPQQPMVQPMMQPVMQPVQQIVQPVYQSMRYDTVPSRMEEKSREEMLSRQTKASGRDCDSRQQPSQYSTLSVASRIRRMPVPTHNGDVDRFLDEVFQQVLTPEDYQKEEVLNAQRIAQSIKGGARPAPDYDDDRAYESMNGSRTYYDPASDDYGQLSDRYQYIDREQMRQKRQQRPEKFNTISSRRMVGDDGGDSRLDSRTLPRHNESRVERQDSRLAYNKPPRQRHLSQPASPPRVRAVEHLARENRPAHTPTQRHRSAHASFDRAPREMYVPAAQQQQSMYMMVPVDSRAPSQMAMAGVQPVMGGQQMMMLMQPGQMMPQQMYYMPPQPQPYHQQSLSQHSLRDYPEQRQWEPESNGQWDAREAPRRQRYDSEIVSRSPSPPLDATLPMSPLPIPRLSTAKFNNTHDTRDTLESPSAMPEPVQNKGLPRLPMDMYRESVVKGETLNSEHPEPHKLPSQRAAIREMEQRERDAIENILDKSKTSNGPSEWVSEDVRNGEPQQSMEIHNVAPIETPQAAKEKPAMIYNRQPWKLTVRKEMFYPGERLDDAQVISQIFAQIIDDCRRDIPYRIREYEREQVKQLLKSKNVPPALMHKQHEIPLDIKVAVIEEARKWPLYFAQFYEVIEERPTESVYMLLAIAEHGIRLLSLEPSDRAHPLSVQDHFQFDDVKDVVNESRSLVAIRTNNDMVVRLRCEQAAAIRAVVEKCLYGGVKQKQFMRAVADYVTKEADLLSFKKGEIIEIIPRPEELASPKGWLHGRIGNRFGNLPAEYVHPVDAPAPHPIPSPLPLLPDDVPNLDSDFENEDGEKLTMMAFALKHFRGPKNEGKKRKEWTWKDVADRVKFTDKPMSHSLLRLDGELDKLACDAFMCILRYMGDESPKRGETLSDCVYKLLLIAREHPPLRDEVYCQLIRQTTNNKSSRPDSSIRGWRLFSIFTAYFKCSPMLKLYLFKYLTDMAHDSRRAYHGTAQLCLHNLTKTFRYGGRKYPLSGAEIEEITNGKILKRQVYMLPGGHQKVVNTRSVTVVEEVLQELCESLNIRSSPEQQEFSLCYVLPGDELVSLPNDVYVLDVCTELEARGQKFVFLLKRSVWIHPLRLDNQMYIDVIFHQLLPEYLAGDFLHRQRGGLLAAALLDDISTLSALVHLASEDDRDNPINAETVYDLLPSTAARAVSGEQWSERVNRKMRLVGARSPTHAKAAFLELIETWPLFGATLFPLFNVSGEERNTGECVLTINRAGLRLLSPLGESIEQISFAQVQSSRMYTARQDHFIDVSLVGDRTLTLHTDKAGEIARLLGQYMFVYRESRGALA